jgi:serine/threonine protein kinase
MRWLGQLQLIDVQPLSEGGHGEVFAAKMVSADGVSQDVVLKLARGKNPVQVEMSRRFLLQEARLTATFNHPNIIGFRDYNLVEIDGEKVPCLIMEHGGVPLSAVLHSHGGRLDPGLAAFVGVEVLEALAYSHSREVIHRDVKPQNVLIGTHGQVRLIDYGIAKAADPRNPSTVVTNLKGTPVYISPEAYKGKKLDGRADIWSVGVMLFELVIGRKPWEDDKSEPNEMVRLRRLSDLVMDAPLPELPKELVPDDLAAVITKMLMKDRDDRYEDALQAMYALEKVVVRLVGPWAAGRELGQQALAASDPTARRRRPTLEESTVNVRHGQEQEGDGQYVSLLVDSPESAASMQLPPEMLEEEVSGGSVAFRADARTASRSTVTSGQLDTPAPRRRERFLKYALVAVAIVGGAAAAAFGTADRSDQRIGGEVRVAPDAERQGVVAEAQARSEPRVALERAHGQVGATEPASEQTGMGRAGEIEPVQTAPAPPVVDDSLPPTGAVAARRDTRTSGEEAHSDGSAKSERGVGDVEVVLIPRGSYVSFDGQAPVKAPTTFHRVRAGSHQLRVGLTERALDRTAKVRVKAGEVAHVELELANPFGD